MHFKVSDKEKDKASVNNLSEYYSLFFEAVQETANKQ